ncbi:MAG: hypothetical protein U9R01_08065 [candidate division WOR-3 bacterium]|nr:hypothetical protein [candidate division WOR-3 bacterium]
MKQYKCKKCGYIGSKLIFQFTEHTYCIATNNKEPEYISKPPGWILDEALGDAEIGEPVGCPKCHAWGVSNFEVIQ